jgi:hypothetical protein
MTDQVADHSLSVHAGILAQPRPSSCTSG